MDFLCRICKNIAHVKSDYPLICSVCASNKPLMKRFFHGTSHYNQKIFRKLLKKWLGIREGKYDLVRRCTKLLGNITMAKDEILTESELNELERLQLEVVRFRFTKNGNKKFNDTFEDQVKF